MLVKNGDWVPFIKVFLNFILMYKLKIRIPISLIIGSLYSAGLIKGISSEKNTGER